uniref:Zinc finger protein n=1 Tax=Romanomermis culicivorax TaxID=13658 RepID=A0A915HXF7_ROMCU
MLPGGLGAINNGNYFYDPNLFGTPVHLLQIPTSVMQSIRSSMMQRQENFCRFTQDGKTSNDLIKCLSNQRDRSFVGEKDIDVGWACRTCNTVFQADNLFTNHQQMVCQSKTSAFKLIQIHYECRKCKQCFGTQ